MNKAAPRGPRRAREAQSAATAVASALSFHGIADEVRGQRVVTEWAELVGAKIAQRTRPAGVVDRVLWVEVATSAWMQELNLLKPRLLEGLRTRLGEPHLFHEVRFRLAGRSRREPTVVPNQRAKVVAARPEVKPASGAVREQIVAEVAGVDDEELRELIARVRITNDK